MEPKQLAIIKNLVYVSPRDESIRVEKYLGRTPDVTLNMLPDRPIESIVDYLLKMSAEGCNLILTKPSSLTPNKRYSDFYDNLTRRLANVAC
jgi:hypothetical protein